MAATSALGSRRATLLKTAIYIRRAKRCLGERKYLGYRPRPPPEGFGQTKTAGPRRARLDTQDRRTKGASSGSTRTRDLRLPKRDMMTTSMTATTTLDETLVTSDDPIESWLTPALMNFFMKTEGDWDTGCWNWAAAKDKDNYPRFKNCNKNRQAHRWIYETLVGPIPEGLDLDHVCVNETCVAPNHLEPVSKAENQRRKVFRRAEAAAGRPIRIKTGATSVQEITLAFALRLPTGGVIILPGRKGARAVRSTSPAPFDTLPMSRLPRVR